MQDGRHLETLQMISPSSKIICNGLNRNFEGGIRGNYMYVDSVLLELFHWPPS